MLKLVFMLALMAGAALRAGAADSASGPTIVPDPFKELERVSNARAHEKALQVAAKEQYFVESFNRLAAALEEFSKTYKLTHAVDAKQAKNVRDAYRRLEKADPWFRGE